MDAILTEDVFLRYKCFMTHLSLEGKLKYILTFPTDEEKLQALLVLIREREYLARQYQEQYHSSVYKKRMRTVKSQLL